MGGEGEPYLCEATLRAVWQRMIAERLPAAAPRFGWPRWSSADYERLLLDQITDAPQGARRDPCPIDLVLAIELADRALRGQVCLKAMARRADARRAGAAQAKL